MEKNLLRLEEKVVPKIISLYNEVINSSYYRKKLELWRKIEEAYNSYMPPTNYPWENASNLDLGIVEMTVDNLKARFKLSTIGAKPMFNIIPITPEGEELKSQVEKMMNFILDNHIDIDKKMDDIALETVKFGTCVVKRLWRKSRKVVRKYMETEKTVDIVDVEQIEEKGDIEILNREDVIVPEGEEDVSKLPFIFHRLWYSPAQLREKARLGIFPKDRVEAVLDFLEERKREIEKAAEEKHLKIEKLPEEKVVVLECYMKEEVDGELEECIFWVAPQANMLLNACLLREVYFDNQRPFYVFRYKKVKNSFWGKGVVEILLPYREALNNLFNYAINCMMLQILPWGFYRLSSAFAPEQVRLGPGVFVPVDDVNDVKIAQFPPVSRIVYDALMFVLSMVEKQTGTGAPFMGKEFPTRKTATEVRAIISEGNIKHEDRIQSFQAVFSDLLKGIYHLYQQNQPTGQYIREVDNAGRVRFVPFPSAWQLKADYDFVILGTLTTGNKVIEREDTLALYALLSKHPLIQQWLPAQQELLKEVLNAFGKKDISRFLMPDEIVRALNELNLAQGIPELAKNYPLTEVLPERPPKSRLPEVESVGAGKEIKEEE